jgi:hypothetical protein
VSHPVNHPSFLPSFLRSLYCMWDVPFLHDSIIPLSFSFNPSNWSSPYFSSATFQNFQGTSDLLSEVSIFQRHTQLCSICSTSPYEYNWLVKKSLLHVECFLYDRWTNGECLPVQS